MPIDNPAMAGTEKDGTRSSEFCIYCYRDGSFMNPRLTLEDMRGIVKDQMQKRNLDQSLVDKALDSLPGLKRWHHEVVGGQQLKK